jgi:hypothetical protein
METKEVIVSRVDGERKSVNVHLYIENLEIGLGISRYGGKNVEKS